VEVVFLRGAEADLLAAWMRYEEILPGLGERFEVEVRAALFRTVELPESAPIYAGEFRRLLLRRFVTEFSTAFTALALWSRPYSICAKTRRRSDGG
jgi:hypothetical protein